MDPDLELQGAIVQLLKADAGVAALVADRVYDNVPKAPVFPYITFGSVDTGTDDAECITGFEIFVQLDVWLREIGFPECKRINNAVRKALHDADITLSTNALVFLEHRRTQTLRDPDGLTSHGAMTFEASVESP